MSLMDRALQHSVAHVTDLLPVSPQLRPEGAIYLCGANLPGRIAMLSALSFTPGLAVATVTTGVSLAAAMGGAQALLPSAAHTPAPHVAVQSAPAAVGLAHAQGSASAGGHLAAATLRQPTAASTQPGCAPTSLPVAAKGVGARCEAAPPSQVPGQGRPGGGGAVTGGKGNAGTHTPPAQPTPVAGNAGRPSPPSGTGTQAGTAHGTPPGR
jgi:hypothetical protein